MDDLLLAGGEALSSSAMGGRTVRGVSNGSLSFIVTVVCEWDNGVRTTGADRWLRRRFKNADGMMRASCQTNIGISLKLQLYKSAVLASKAQRPYVHESFAEVSHGAPR